jgi:hypothetical protein
MKVRPRHWSSRLPFYFGRVIVGIALVTMAIGVTAFQAPKPDNTPAQHMIASLPARAP